MFRSNLEEIKSKFTVLLQCIQSALEANNVTKEAVRSILVGMYPNCEEHIPNTNMGEIFAAASHHKLWTYEHYSPVEKLVRRLLTSDHLGEVRAYKAHLSGYFITVKLIDYIKHTNIDSTVTSVDYDIELKELTTSLDLNTRLDSVSLKYIQDLWEEFVKEFNIPPLSTITGKIRSGSHHNTSIATVARESSFFQNHPDITNVTIDDTVQYDEVNPIIIIIIIIAYEPSIP